MQVSSLRNQLRIEHLVVKSLPWAFNTLPSPRSGNASNVSKISGEVPNQLATVCGNAVRKRKRHSRAAGGVHWGGCAVSDEFSYVLL